MGRSNYLPEWELAKPATPVSFDIDDPSTYRLSYIPYSKTPSPGLRYWQGPQLATEQRMAQNILGGLATVPPDNRLDFGFQDHMLRALHESSDGVFQTVNAIQKQLRQFNTAGGLFEIRDYDAYDGGVTYSLFSTIDATEAEEFHVKIPSVAWLVSNQGLPIQSRSIYYAPWRRLV